MGFSMNLVHWFDEKAGRAKFMIPASDLLRLHLGHWGKKKNKSAAKFKSILYIPVMWLVLKFTVSLTSLLSVFAWL